VRHGRPRRDSLINVSERSSPSSTSKRSNHREYPFGLQPHANAEAFLAQLPIKLLCFSIAVVQSPVAAFPAFLIPKSKCLENAPGGFRPRQVLLRFRIRDSLRIITHNSECLLSPDLTRANRASEISRRSQQFGSRRSGARRYRVSPRSMLAFLETNSLGELR